MSPMRYLFSIPRCGDTGNRTPTNGVTSQRTYRYTISPFVWSSGYDPLSSVFQTDAITRPAHFTYCGPGGNRTLNSGLQNPCVPVSTTSPYICAACRIRTYSSNRIGFTDRRASLTAPTRQWRNNVSKNALPKKGYKRMEFFSNFQINFYS